LKELKNEVMAKHTTFKIGGIADFFLVVDTKEELCNALKTVNHKMIGNGSNLIISDDGYRGAFIKLGKGFKNIKYNKGNLTVGAGVMISKLLVYCKKNGFTGLEGLSGIPATIGGAIYMNAGYTRSIANSVIEVRGITTQGIDFRFKNSNCLFGYRSSIFQKTNAVITDVILKVTKAKPLEVAKNINKLLARREKTQPINYPSCGSIFKKANISVFKGYVIGDIEVSTLCSSFFINKGKGKSKDVVALIKRIREISKDNLVLEAEIIGDNYESKYNNNV